jgi:glutathione synthase/RimK-type ligase-like ATP-grasp enzyme
MYRDQAAIEAAEALNAGCHCVNVELTALRGAVEARLAAHGLPADLAASHPHLFSRTPVFLSAAHARRMAGTVRAVEAAAALPTYREAALQWAPAIARHDSGTGAAFLGFDFHLSADGPKLIEVNTNAGGGFLAAMLGEAALACCGTAGSQGQGQGHPAFEQRVIDMLVEEWHRAGRTGRPRAIAIVDEAPENQYLYPEFLLAQSALRRAGIQAVVASPGELQLRGGALCAGDQPVDLVYNRLTDFALEAPAHRALQEAYLGGIAVVTPNPRAHALYADKRLLGLLGDAAWLRGAGLDPALAGLLGEVVPATATVRSEDGARLWQERKNLFFKPFAGYGSRGAYRGGKLTRRVFEEILRGGYVAQALVPPGERIPAEHGAALKFDVRNFAYGGEVQLLAARLWQGQTTNFRSEGGGFAPVLVLP